MDPLATPPGAGSGPTAGAAGRFKDIAQGQGKEAGRLEQIGFGTLQLNVKEVNGPSGLGGPSFVLHPGGDNSGKKYPLISFAHSLGGVTTAIISIAHMGMLRYIASRGYVIVAMTSCSVCGTLGMQSDLQLKLIEDMKQHPLASMVDFDSVGVVGHSLGGGATVQSTLSPKNDHIKAAIAFNPSPTGGPQSALSLITKAQVPTFYFTSKLDYPGFELLSRAYFNQNKLKGSALLIALKSTHNYVNGLGLQRVIQWTVTFLDCHLKGDQNSCNEVRTQMCSKMKRSMKACSCKVRH